MSSQKSMQVLTLTLLLLVSFGCQVHCAGEQEILAKAQQLEEKEAGRVQVRVYRGPNGKDNFVQWGYFVKQPAEF